MCARLIDQVDEHPPTAEKHAGSSEPAPATTAVVRATGGIRVVLQVLGSLVKPKSLLENPQTHALQQRDRQSGTKPGFDPLPIYLQLRCSLFPLILRVWSAPWLPLCPPTAVRLCTSAFMSVLDGKHEAPVETVVGESSGRFGITNPQPRPPPVVPTPLAADPARVAQLTDMGFSRGAAEWALLRTRNNIAAATEMIISMPHLFEGMEESAADMAAPVPNEATGDTVVPTNLPTAEDGDNEHDVEMADAPTAPTSEPIVHRDIEAMRKEIGAQRMAAAEAAPDQALRLLQQAEEYVQDVLPIFINDKRGLQVILNTVSEINTQSDDSFISFALRLLAIFLRTKENVDLSVEDGTTVIRTLSSLQINPETPPVWTPRVMLLTEIILTSNQHVTKARIGDSSSDRVLRDDLPITDLASRMCVLCRSVLDNPSSARDLYVSAFRLAVLLEQRRKTQSSMAPIFSNAIQALTEDHTKSPGCQPYVTMVARHMVEDAATLEQAIRSEVRQFFSPTHSKVSDINHVVSQLRAVINRAPAVFLKVVASECVLIDPSPAQSVYHIRLKEPGNHVTDTVDVFDASPAEQQVIDILVRRLRDAVKAHQDLTADSEASVPPETLSALLFKIGTTVSILTELVGSYLSAKNAFVAVLQKVNVGHEGSSKGITTSGLTQFILDLVGCVDLHRDLSEASLARHQSPSSRLTLFGWGASNILSLCTDPYPDAEDGENDSLLSIRKAVVDSIAKILRDHSSKDANARYGQLWAMAELTYRLLVVRPVNPTNGKIDQGGVMAKIMLEKNLFGLFTSTTADMDFNFPEIRAVLVALLRCLEQLSKSSIRWAQTRKTLADAPPSDLASTFSSETGDTGGEDDENEEDEDIGYQDEVAERDHEDPYRHTSLAMNYADHEDDLDDEEDDEEDEDEDMDMHGEMDDEIDGDEDDVMTESSDESSDIGGEEGSLHEAGSTDFVDVDDDDEDQDGPDGHAAGAWELTEGDEFDGEATWDEGEEGDVVDEGEYTDEDGEGDDGLDAEGGLPDSMEMASEMELELDELEGTYEVFEATMPSRSDPMATGPAAITGWGWTDAGDGGDASGTRVEGRRSRLIGEFGAPPRQALIHSCFVETDPAAALFGGRGRQATRSATAGAASEVAQHPLLQNDATPNAEADRSAMTARRMQPSASNHINEILQSIAGGHMPSPSNLMERLSSIRDPNSGNEVVINATGPGQIELRIHQEPSAGAPSQPPAPDLQGLFGSRSIAIAAPVPTLGRWTQELSSFGGMAQETQSRLVVHIVNALLPAAREEAAKEEERVRAETAAQQAAEVKARQEELSAALTVPLPESRASPLPPPVSGSIESDRPGDVDMGQCMF